MGSPYIVGSNFRVETGSPSFPVVQHSLTRVGDLVVLIVGNDSTGDSVTFTPDAIAGQPYDWVTLTADIGDSSNDSHQATFYRVATSAGQVYTYGTISESDDVWSATLTIRDWDPSNPPYVIEDDMTVSNGITFNGGPDADINKGSLFLASATTDGGDLLPSSSVFGWVLVDEIAEGTDGNAVAGTVFEYTNAVDDVGVKSCNIYFSASDGIAGTHFIIPTLQAAPSLETEASSWSSNSVLGQADYFTPVAIAPTQSQPVVPGSAEWSFPLSPVNTIQRLYCYNYFTIAVANNGDVHCCGASDNYGQVAAANTWTNALWASVGDRHTVACLSNGTIVSAGDNTYGQTDGLDGVTGVVQVVAGSYGVARLHSDGTVVFTGNNSENWAAGAPTLSGVVRIAKASFALMALMSDGTVTGIGSDSYGVISGTTDWTGIVDIACSSGPTCYGLKADGTVLCSGYDVSGMHAAVAAWTDIVSIGGLKEVAIGVHSDGSCSLAGLSTDEAYIEAVAADLTNIKVVSQGGSQSWFAAKDDGSVESGGYGTYNECTRLWDLGVYIPPILDGEASTLTHAIILGNAFGSSQSAAPTFTRTQVIGTTLWGSPRPLFSGSLSKCFLEDSAGNQLSALSIDIQYSGKNSTVFVVISLPFDAGKAFIDALVFPLFIIANGSSVFKITELETSEYVGGLEKSYLVTVRTFASVRPPTEVATPTQTRITCTTTSLLMEIPDAYDIVPGDILIAGSQPPMVVSSTSIHIKDNESRSIVYG